MICLNIISSLQIVPLIRNHVILVSEKGGTAIGNELSSCYSTNEFLKKAS